jgi:hypothetical protein
VRYALYGGKICLLGENYDVGKIPLAIVETPELRLTVWRVAYGLYRTDNDATIKTTMIEEHMYSFYL